MKLQQKIPLYVITVMLLVGGMGALALLSSQKQSSTQLFSETASTLTDTILNSLEQDMLRSDRGHIQLTLDNLSRQQNIRSIDILSTDGTIWASSNRESIGSVVDPEAVAVMDGDHPHEIFGEPADDHMTDVAAIPVKDECLMCHGRTTAPPNQSGNLGGIRVDIGTTSLQESLGRSRQILLIVGGATFVLVAGTLVLLLRLTALAPLAKLTEASTRISRGDYSARVPEGDPVNEISAVSKAFNEMAGTVEQHTLQLESANRELEQASRMKSEFLANMSHELRTPLNVIIGFSEVLRDTPSNQMDDSDRTEFCDNIVNSGHHLLELINDVLDLAKVEAGQMQLIPEEFYIGTTLKEIISTMQPLAAKRHIDLGINVSEHLTTVYADVAKFKQILFNLIGNALKFTPEGGSVRVNASVMGNMARFAVTDTGVGIAEADQERIFSEFQQVDGSSSRQYEGTGLGLALTRKFVELQKGEIWVESRIGLGSTFYFTLPLPAESGLPVATRVERYSDTSPEAIQLACPVDEGKYATTQPSPTVLVVEDDRKTAELIGLWLTRDGYDVDYATDGVEALEKARENHPFAICLDIMLPRKDGWQVLHQLKADPETADLGVIICSALDNPELGFALGAADYCVKPLSRRHLLDKLRYLKEVSPGRRSQPQVLVADSDREAAHRTASILERQGFGVIHASDGKDAIDLALEQSPDIIIVDFNLPDVASYDVVSFLRNHPITVDTPVIVTTEREISGREEDMLRSGQVEKIIRKGDSGKDQLLGEMFRLEKLHPEKALLIDGETRMFNRRYFEKRLAEEVKRAERYSLDLSLMMIVLDSPAGLVSSHAQRLAALTGILRSNVRAADPLARYDTCRFGILLPETTREAAFRVAGKVVELVREKQITGADGKVIPLSVSVAVTGDHGGIRTPDQLVESLDAALRVLADQDGDAARLV
ncbi:MAG: response regulator [Actinobacteria bacterium]|nr:response regulator [Actinomycetota bacterium]